MASRRTAARIGRPTGGRSGGTGIRKRVSSMCWIGCVVSITTRRQQPKGPFTGHVYALAQNAGRWAAGEESASRFTPLHQPLQLPAAGPHPLEKLGRHQVLLLAVDLAAHRRALQTPAPTLNTNETKASNLPSVSVTAINRSMALGETGVPVEQFLCFLVAVSPQCGP